MKSYKARGVFWPIRGFLGLFKPIGDTVSVPKKVNDGVSCNGKCKFEFNTIKTTIVTYIMTFWTNIRKSPKKGYF